MASLSSHILQWRFAFRNIFRHYARTLATLSAIAFGCFSVQFSGGYFEDVFRKMRESYINSHIGHIQIYQKGFLEHETTYPFDYMLDVPDKLIETLDEIPEVYSVAQRINFSGLISVGDNNAGILVQAINPEKDKARYLEEALSKRPRKMSDREFGWPIITKGRHLKNNDSFEVIVGQGLAESMNISIGDTIVILTNTISGSINALDLEVVGEYFTSSKDIDDRSVRVSIPTGKSLLSTDSIQSLIVLLNETENTDLVKSKLENYFEKDNLDYEMKTWEQLADFYLKTRVLFGAFFVVILVIIGVIITLSIFNTMSMAVLERTVEIGTIRALGASSKSIVYMFIREGLIIGVIGGLLGVILGSLIVYIVAIVGITMPPPPGATMKWLAEPAVVPKVMLYVFLLSVITSVIAAIIPARKASKMQIADSLRHVL